MAGRIDKIPLVELYEKEKITPAVFKNIVIKEDFTKIRKTFCEKACKLPEDNKSFANITLATEKVDILIVVPFPSMDDSWKSGGTIDKINNGIIQFLANEKFGDLKHKTVYAMKCRPPSGEKVPLSTVKCCTPYLANEIKRTAPRIVLGLGTDVGKALGAPKVVRGSNRVITSFGTTFNLICTLHPKILTMIRQNSSGDFWGPDYLDVLRWDFGKAAAIARGEVALVPLKDSIELTKSNRIFLTTELKHIFEFVTYIRSQERPIISMDTETTSLDPWAENAKLLCIQFGYASKEGFIRSIVIPLWHRDNTFYDANLAWEMIVPLLEDPAIEKVTHNGMFDLLYIRVTKGVEVANVSFDTMLLLHSLNSGLQGYYDLKSSTSDHLFEMQLSEYDSSLVLSDIPDEVEEIEGE